MSRAAALAELVRASRGLSHKADIAGVLHKLALGADAPVAVGDDTAIIPDGENALLFSIEGFVEDFVAADPWFAGYCGVMVNVSDVLAMGGRPIAVVDALWSRDETGADPILAGMREAARRYDVPVVGGHSNLRAASGQLAVAILGKAAQPVSSFGASPGDVVLIATDLAGAFRDPFPWWDASTTATDAHIARLLPIMPALAEAGRLTAAKDISMAGVLGTAVMLAEASAVGMTIDVESLPRPEDVAIERWLAAFPSFGFVMTARPDHTERVKAAFAAAGVACAAVGSVESEGGVRIVHEGETATVWSAHAPLTGCRENTAPRLETTHA